ncbi:probable mediator of RNA polymerase II transcription subunit 26c isoform X1 [Nicotiana tomentosiformis]|uniref:probable mediator of RNA polymerase II transcription subunit 26c isoform X1 n=1 Tax=Nicotiana tomentosiformis TaxID=4098 RepID=UPI00051BCBFF|nr:probable mediator of RNA polymerase II transcription subunit 26c isoform X1 [Nicotiana tomentosiformis]
MELDEFRLMLENSSVDLWTFIDTAISVAILDHGNELLSRRDAIVEKLYAPLLCKNCNSAGNCEDLETKIIRIKKLLENPNQSENCLVELLQTLAEMDINFKVLEITDVGRHVNRLRKHSSNEVRRLVKLLIRRWKDIVDEWVRLNTQAEETGDANSPFQPHLNNNFQERAPLYGISSNGSSSYCAHKQSIENNNITPSSKRLQAHHVGVLNKRTREVGFLDVRKQKKL